MTGIELIAAERKRQVEEEGWTPEHDEGHEPDTLARAAACYALPAWCRTMVWGRMPEHWPWNGDAWKPTPDDRTRELVKAAALLVSEIDRRLAADDV